MGGSSIGNSSSPTQAQKFAQVLLGGDAGLRPGEVRALHWTSIDFGRQRLTIERSEYTFCSHLAMRGAPTKAVQELAGHADLTTTQRYMHLSPATLDASIRLLDRRPRDPGDTNENRPANKMRSEFGDILETGRS